MFSVTPECLTGMLFCSRMRDDEAILIRGAERYSDYTGYAQTFEYVGNHDDPAPLYVNSSHQTSMELTLLGIKQVIRILILFVLMQFIIESHINNLNQNISNVK